MRQNLQMELVVLASAAILAFTFLIAGVAKLRDPNGTREAIIGFGVPPSWASDAGVFLLPAAELLVATLLVIPRTSVVGGVGALLLLGLFIAAIGWNLAQGRQPDCHCFGQVHSAPVGGWTVLRNVLLAGLSLVVLIGGGTEPSVALAWWEGSATALRVLIAMTILVLGMVTHVTHLLLKLTRDIAALQEASLRTHVTDQPTSLLAGDKAPYFELPDLEGNMVSLDDLLAQQKPALLVFSSPGCGPCNELFPEIAGWQAAYSNLVTVAVLASGNAEENMTKAAQHGIRTLLLQKDAEPALSFRATATPSAVLVEPDGSVSIGLAAGPGAIRKVFNDLVSKHVSELWREATGEKVELVANVATIGERLPALELADLRGRIHNTAALGDEPTVLVLWSPSCNYCRELLPRLRNLERSRTSPRLVFVTNGTSRDNAAQRLRSLVLLDSEFTLGRALGATGTPSAVIVDGGIIASRLGVGSEGVESLIEEAVQRKREGSGVS